MWPTEGGGERNGSDRWSEAVFAVVVVGIGGEPACLRRVAGVAGEGSADEAFEAGLGGVGGHGVGSNTKRTPSWRSISKVFR